MRCGVKAMPDDPEFQGEIPFDLTLSMFGKTVTRRAKVVYQHWLKEERTIYHIEVEGVVEDYEDDDGPPVIETQWVFMSDMAHDGILSDEMWDAMIDAIAAKCKAEDRRRKRRNSRK
jgi:hypothetical protein